MTRVTRAFVFVFCASSIIDVATDAPWSIALSALDSRYDWTVLGLAAAGTPLAAIVAPFVFVRWSAISCRCRVRGFHGI
jgi:hypothetical protein